jgi:type IV secretion system protein VirB11
MNPDRILLAEIRGREAWDALKIVGSGHEGLITSLHAGSPEECIEGIIDRCYENPDCRNIPFDVLLRKVLKALMSSSVLIYTAMCAGCVIFTLSQFI